jgi:hypothetical protein
MLPRGAQIQKVRAEINSGLLKKYGKITKLEIDKENKTIKADLDLKGEKECIQIRLSNYRLIQEDGKNPVFEPGTIEVSREWLDALLKRLRAWNIITWITSGCANGFTARMAAISTRNDYCGGHGGEVAGDGTALMR